MSNGAVSLIERSFVDEIGAVMVLKAFPGNTVLFSYPPPNCDELALVQGHCNGDPTG
jgi:hypothetical protein